MRVRVVAPPNGKWIYNGYLGHRVMLGEETELPDYRVPHDPNGKPKERIAVNVPRWAELLEAGVVEEPVPARVPSVTERKAKVVAGKRPSDVDLTEG